MKRKSRRESLSVVLAARLPGFFASRLRNPIFIIGYPRSGKALLARLIGLHRNVAFWSEANDVWDPKGYPWRTSSRETPPVWFDPAAFTARWWRDVRPRQAEIRAIFGAYQWLCRAPYFLNETPLNTFRIPYLLSMFPEARFIHMVRDGRAAVYSTARNHYEKIQAQPEPYQEFGLAYAFEELAVVLASFWKTSLEEVSLRDEELALRRKGVLLELTYEELCADPAAALDRVCGQLGLDPSGLAHALEKDRLTNRNDEWHESFDATLIPRLIAAMEPTLSSRGYV